MPITGVRQGGNGVPWFEWRYSQGQGSAGTKDPGARKSTNIQVEKKTCGRCQLRVSRGEADLADSNGGVPRPGAVSGAEIYHFEKM